MISKKQILFGIGIGLMIGILFSVGAEVIFGIDEISHYFTFDRILPDAIINILNNTPAVINISTDDYSTQVWYNATLTNNTQQEIENYIHGLDYLFTRNDYLTTTFPGYQFPSCHWDYGTNQKIGVYWYNGNQIIIQGDEKC